MSNGEMKMDRIEILRNALTFGESSYSNALDRHDYDTANFLGKTIDGLRIMLVETIMSESNDPHTTAADVRYFENICWPFIIIPLY